MTKICVSCFPHLMTRNARVLIACALYNMIVMSVVLGFVKITSLNTRAPLFVPGLRLPCADSSCSMMLPQSISNVNLGIVKSSHVILRRSCGVLSMTAVGLSVIKFREKGARVSCLSFDRDATVSQKTSSRVCCCTEVQRSSFIVRLTPRLMKRKVSRPRKRLRSACSALTNNAADGSKI